MMFKLLVVLFSIFFFIGCAEKQTLDMEAKPKYQVQKKVTPPVSNKGSLFTRKSSSIFADKRELQIGDIVKVEITIEDTIKSGVTAGSSSKSSVDKGIGNFSGDSSAAKKLNSAIGIGFNLDSSSSSNAGANSETSDEITDSFISAIVKEVYQNGNYFIQGSRETLILGQKLTVKISGVISPQDLGETDGGKDGFIDNGVNSRDIANLKILYEKDGEEVDITKKKWGTRLIDAIWPF